jgi:hypothetical protein
MRGRRPSGPEYVERLEGSAQAKERLHVVLQTLAGTCRVQQACDRLGVCAQRFHQLRTQLLQAALDSLEPQPAGRPCPVAPDAQTQELAAAVQQLQVELRAAQTREEIALVLPQVLQPDQRPGKKAPRRRTARSPRRPQ